jgi:Hint domain
VSAVFSFVNKILQSVGSVGLPADREDAFDDDRPVEWNLGGFTGQVRVRTTFGDLPIDALRIGDEIRTASGQVERVRWIDKLHLDEDFLTRHTSARPIRIPENTFGVGRPSRDLMVSPGQQVCVDANPASTFRPAAELCVTSQADRLPTAGLTYYRFNCGGPASVHVEGVWVRV